MRTGHSRVSWLWVAAVVLAGGAGWVGAQQKAPFFNVRDYGAVGSGQAKDTEAIRKAIDAAVPTRCGRVCL